LFGLSGVVHPSAKQGIEVDQRSAIVHFELFVVKIVVVRITSRISEPIMATNRSNISVELGIQEVKRV